MINRPAVYLFAAALVLYALWVAALAALAITSGSRPTALKAPTAVSATALPGPQRDR